MNRRNFIKYLSSTALLSLIVPIDLSFGQTASGYKDKVISKFIELILPVNNSAILNIESFKSKLNENLRNNANAEKVIDYGIKFFDHNANLLYQKRQFLQLTKTEQLEIINFTINNTVSLERPDPSRPWTDIRYGKTFFNNLRSFTMHEFYSSSAGWKYLGYDGPPQFKGNVDYTKCSY